MKKMLGILGTISLVGTSTTSLVACNKPQYSEDELKIKKEKNNIKTKDGILEWIAPQEKLFNQIDDKYYFVVWRGNKNNGWHIVKFKNNEITIKIDNFKGYKLVKHNYGMRDKDLYIRKESGISISPHWESNNGNYFKSVYRWDGIDEPDIFEIDNNGNIKN